MIGAPSVPLSQSAALEDLFGITNFELPLLEELSHLHRELREVDLPTFEEHGERETPAVSLGENGPDDASQQPTQPAHIEPDILAEQHEAIVGMEIH